MKRTFTLLSLMLAASILSACNAIPATLVVMQITNTPDPRVISVTITNTSAPGTQAASPSVVSPNAAATISVPTNSVTSTIAVTSGALPVATAAVTSGALPAAVATTLVPSTAVPTNGASSSAATVTNGTATPNYIPTETRQQLAIAQEDFQYGYMFWISATKDDWVLLPATPGTPQPNSGQWRVYKDTYLDSEPETDPSIVPPDATLFQPKRGFGKLWRTEPDIRSALGWGTTPEFGINTSYVYQPGGSYDAQQGKWIFGPGTHFLISLGRQTFAFHEPANGQTYGTWEKVG